MIIDTMKLREMVNCRDDNVDFERCSAARLNSLEKIAIDSMRVIEEVENLAQQLYREKMGNLSNNQIKNIHGRGA